MSAAQGMRIYDPGPMQVSPFLRLFTLWECRILTIRSGYDAVQDQGLETFSAGPKNLSSIWLKMTIYHHQLQQPGY